MKIITDMIEAVKRDDLGRFRELLDTHVSRESSRRDAIERGKMKLPSGSYSIESRDDALIIYGRPSKRDAEAVIRQGAALGFNVVDTTIASMLDGGAYYVLTTRARKTAWLAELKAAAGKADAKPAANKPAQPG